jgi:hypothetical protein
MLVLLEIVGVTDGEDKDVTTSAATPSNSEGSETTAGKSWWSSILEWFDDDSKQSGDAAARADAPVGDHRDAQVVRTCEQCGHVWAQR